MLRRNLNYKASKASSRATIAPEKLKGHFKEHFFPWSYYLTWNWDPDDFPWLSCPTTGEIQKASWKTQNVLIMIRCFTLESGVAVLTNKTISLEIILIQPLNMWQGLWHCYSRDRNKYHSLQLHNTLVGRKTKKKRNDKEIKILLWRSELEFVVGTMLRLTSDNNKYTVDFHSMGSIIIEVG